MSAARATSPSPFRLEMCHFLRGRSSDVLCFGFSSCYVCNKFLLYHLFAPPPPEWIRRPSPSKTPRFAHLLIPMGHFVPEMLSHILGERFRNPVLSSKLPFSLNLSADPVVRLKIELTNNYKASSDYKRKASCKGVLRRTDLRSRESYCPPPGHFPSHKNTWWEKYKK